MARGRRKRPGTALITGASSGIGAALARRFAAGGFDVVLVARRVAPLRALARSLEAAHPIRARIRVADLARPGAVRMLAAALVRERVRVDVLVNNAGIIEAAPFVALDAARSQALIALNVSAATALVAAFLPPMVRRRHGRVLNVCSIAAFLPVPTLATYAATKAYLLSLSESLAAELEGSGVSVTALCPGITDTPMKTAVLRARPRLRRLPSIAIAPADAVAAEGYEACLRGDAVCVPGLLNRVTSLGGRVLPGWAVRGIAAFAGREFT